ncbi:MAG: hypothetical protein ACK5LM_05235 [Lactovum sp.]
MKFWYRNVNVFKKLKEVMSRDDCFLFLKLKKCTVEYRENGFLLYLKVTPVNIVKKIFSLTVIQFLIMAMQTLLLPALVLILSLSLFVLVGLGFVISIFAKNIKNTITISNLLTLILTFLGGEFFPRDV